MKKTMTFVLCSLMTLSCVACGGKTKKTEIPDPYTEYSVMEEATKAVGFEVTVPDTIDGYATRIIRVDAESKLIEVVYTNNEDAKICIRKAAGSNDISGDYTSYSQNNTVTINNLSVIMKGDNDVVSVATWADNGYTYSVGAYMQTGLSVATITGLISSIQ